MPSPIRFKIEKKLKNSLGRVGVLHTPHGDIETPAFVTVGTKATVKALTTEQVKDLGAQVVLANTYHLYLQPGPELVEQSGGLGKFMNWSGPTMTDSGGFQVFSLGAAYGKNRSLSKLGKKSDKDEKEELLLPEAESDEDDPSKSPQAKLVSIDHDGVMFRSHIDGSAHYFTPEKSIDIQHKLGADMFFAFDECTSPVESYHYQQEALARTHRWAKRCLDYHQSKDNKHTQALFGVVQGGRHEDLRKESAEFFAKMDFDGYGIGGSFAKEDMSTAVEWVNGILPEEKPRHLLGIGEPMDLFMGAERGIDLFDCVAPTRMGRSGSLYTEHGRINIRNAQFSNDVSPIDSKCACDTCKKYTKAYLSHLFKADEMLAATLASVHNLYFIVNLVKRIRQSMLDDTFFEFRDAFLKGYYKA